MLDAEGTEVASYRTVKEAGALLLSVSDLVDGEVYTLEVGGTQVATATAGEYDGGDFAGPPR
ncbi:hypothetical protein [Nocardioides sambongensis]|uniref:hypothetical protein n=1 Tax=Nocardioides sambongensis TaxID=2589074 RepID=UPI0011289EE5|nr:hypothetical protein [Nocardioides sambongensis]